MSSIDLLLEAANILSRQKKTDACVWLAEQIRAAIDSGRSLDELVGLRGPVGQGGSHETPVRLYHYRQRDRKFHELAATVCASTKSARARLISGLLSRETEPTERQAAIIAELERLNAPRDQRQIYRVLAGETISARR